MKVTKTIISTFEGVTWIEGVHHRFVGDFGEIEIIQIPPGVKQEWNPKTKKFRAKNPITIRYGIERQGEPA